MSDLWTFRGVSFKRLSPGDTDTQWFQTTVARTVDVAVGDVSGSTRRWVDLGAIERAPLQITAACATAGDRTALLGYLGTVGTLVAVGGQSGQAALVRADVLIADGGPFYRIALEFEYAQ